MAAHNEFGKEGEKIARDYLQAKGYEIIEQNWRNGKHELDLITRFQDRLIIVEVKSRKNTVLEVVDVMSASKEKSLLKAVNSFLENFNDTVDCQIDLIVIEKKDTTFTVNHIEDAISQ